jgi:D-inositol-3-phosphate glycosyltransferase
VAKVLIVGPAHPLRGGLATYNERLAKAINQQGHECEILSFSLQYPSLFFPGKTQFTNDAPPQNLVIHSLINSLNPINWIITANRLSSKQYDIVVFRYWMSFMAPSFGTIARVLKQNNPCKILAIVDNLIPHEPSFLDTIATPYFIESCDGFLTMSEAVKTQLDQWPVQKNVVYTPHPMYDMFGPIGNMHEAKLKIGLNPQENYLLFFGFIRGYKGLGLLLDALTIEPVRKIPFKVIIAGEFYEDSKPYLDKIKSLGLEDKLVMRNDFIPNNQVCDYFNAADAVIQPYTSATQSGVTQIAYYYNKPMIVTNVGGLAELVPHQKSGLVCNPTAGDIAKAIAQFYEQNMMEKLSDGSAAEKYKFTWETLIEKLLSLAS